MIDIVQRVIELSQEYESKRKIHEAEHGTAEGFFVGERKAEGYFEATEFLDRKIKLYLESLPETELRKLQTLVYFGRGDDDDIFSLHEHLTSVSPTREDVIRTVVEKAPALSTYLLTALRRVERSGIDIDGSFEKVE